MAITREQALTAREFHMQKGSVCEKWRRNGQTKTWKRQPDKYRVPVKYGMYSYDYITEMEQDWPNLHTAEDCPNKAR